MRTLRNKANIAFSADGCRNTNVNLFQRNSTENHQKFHSKFEITNFANLLLHNNEMLSMICAACCLILLCMQQLENSKLKHIENSNECKYSYVCLCVYESFDSIISFSVFVSNCFHRFAVVFVDFINIFIWQPSMHVYSILTCTMCICT